MHAVFEDTTVQRRRQAREALTADSRLAVVVVKAVVVVAAIPLVPVVAVVV